NEKRREIIILQEKEKIIEEWRMKIDSITRDFQDKIQLLEEENRRLRRKCEQLAEEIGSWEAREKAVIAAAERQGKEWKRAAEEREGQVRELERRHEKELKQYEDMTRQQAFQREREYERMRKELEKQKENKDAELKEKQQLVEQIRRQIEIEREEGERRLIELREQSQIEANLREQTMQELQKELNTVGVERDTWNGEIQKQKSQLEAARVQLALRLAEATSGADRSAEEAAEIAAQYEGRIREVENKSQNITSSGVVEVEDGTGRMTYISKLDDQGINSFTSSPFESDNANINKSTLRSTASKQRTKTSKSVPSKRKSTRIEKENDEFLISQNRGGGSIKQVNIQVKSVDPNQSQSDSLMEVEIGGDMKVMKKKKKKKSINQSNIDLTDGKKHKISDSRITLIMKRSSVDKDKDKKEDGFDEYGDGRKEKKNKTNLKDKQQQQQQQQQQGGSARVNISNNSTIERSSSTKKR
ncbi:MAG: hypothetical protein EZS28_021218, partial [Streblomastix strix]